MKKFKLVIIGIGILICTILIRNTNHKEKMPAQKSVPVREDTMGVSRLKIDWFPPYPFEI